MAGKYKVSLQDLIRLHPSSYNIPLGVNSNVGYNLSTYKYNGENVDFVNPDTSRCWGDEYRYENSYKVSFPSIGPGTRNMFFATRESCPYVTANTYTNMSEVWAIPPYTCRAYRKNDYSYIDIFYDEYDDGSGPANQVVIADKNGEISGWRGGKDVPGTFIIIQAQGGNTEAYGASGDLYGGGGGGACVLYLNAKKLMYGLYAAGYGKSPANCFRIAHNSNGDVYVYRATNSSYTNFKTIAVAYHANNHSGGSYFDNSDEYAQVIAGIKGGDGGTPGSSGGNTENKKNSFFNDYVGLRIVQRNYDVYMLGYGSPSYYRYQRRCGGGGGSLLSCVQRDGRLFLNNGFGYGATGLLTDEDEWKRRPGESVIFIVTTNKLT